MTRVMFAVFGVVALFAVGILIFDVSTLAGKALGPTSRAATVDCATTNTTYTVTVQHSRLSTSSVHARLCDRLTIVNDDPTLRLMAFGPHDHHQPYDGITEQVLAQGQSLSVTLNQAGTFTFHDHLHDELQGTFTIQ